MRTLVPPREIANDYFLLIWDPIGGVYVLSLTDGRSYELGDDEDTRIYFTNVLQLGELGDRAMDSARNWYTTVVIPKDNRCFHVETKESQTEYQRLFKTPPPELIIV